MDGDQVVKTIQDLAERQRLSGAELARLAGIPRNTHYRRMKRPADMTMEELQRYAHVLGVTAAELLGTGAAA